MPDEQATFSHLRRIRLVLLPVIMLPGVSLLFGSSYLIDRDLLVFRNSYNSGIT